MASFQAKMGRDRLRMRETKTCSYQFLANPEFIILKKQQKNSKKLKNIIMASFQAKMGWDRLRMREKKKNHSYQFLSNLEYKIPKKQQKNSKN